MPWCSLPPPTNRVKVPCPCLVIDSPTKTTMWQWCTGDGDDFLPVRGAKVDGNDDRVVWTCRDDQPRVHFRILSLNNTVGRLFLSAHRSLGDKRSGWLASGWVQGLVQPGCDRGLVSGCVQVRWLVSTCVQVRGLVPWKAYWRGSSGQGWWGGACFHSGTE